MANIKSQIKRIKITKAQTLRNRSARSKLKTHIKNFLAYIEAADKTAASGALNMTLKVIDSAASKGIIHKNNAAGRKSRLTRKLNALMAAPDVVAEEAAPGKVKKAAAKKPAAKKPASRKTTAKKPAEPATEAAPAE